LAEEHKKSGPIYFPRNSLKEALKVPKAIWDYNAGNPFAIGDLAGKVGYSPTSGSFRELLRSSQRYGLTDGSWQSDVTKTIALAPVGSSIVAPSAGEDVNAVMREALEKPDVFRDFLTSINGKVIPPPDVCKNTLTVHFRWFLGFFWFCAHKHIKPKRSTGGQTTERFRTTSRYFVPYADVSGSTCVSSCHSLNDVIRIIGFFDTYLPAIATC
jgi:hypothetical protein